MTIKLPKAIEAYFEADRTGSPDAIAGTFTENGIVKDKGKTHMGRDAIRAWMADEAQQYSYTVEPFLITIPHAASSFLTMASVLEDYEFERYRGRARVVMQPSGVAAAITPWNSNIGFITSKLATAIAAGSTIVIKPSEMSATQTQILTECLHEAGLPKGANRVKFCGAPYSSAIAWVRSVTRPATAAFNRFSMSMRSAFDVRENAGKARFAAATASRASSTPASRTVPIFSSVDGL